MNLLIIFYFTLINKFIYSLKDIPLRGRNGIGFKQSSLYAATYNQSVKHIAYTWNASIDNFNINDGTFLQRYYVDNQYWIDQKGPVFFEISGEGNSDYEIELYIYYSSISMILI